MAQAPSPQSDPAEPNASAQSPDELLSQLAGSEIDRLLAEGEVETPRVPPPKPPRAKPEAKPRELPKPTAVADKLEQSVATQLDDLFNELKGDESPAPAAATEPNPEATTEGAERTALLEAAGFNKDTQPAPAAESPDPVHEGDADQTERAALLQAAGFDAEKPPAAPVRKIARAPVADRPLPVYLKPLEWINAPMDHCSPAVRQMLGRAGIVTLINALAALGYVLLLRKH
jgi:hypothetical protein